MKNIISIQLKTKKTTVIECKTDLLAIGCFSDDKKLTGLSAEIDSKLAGAIDKLVKLGDFKGKEKSTAIVYGNEKIGAKRVLLIGLGEKKKVTIDTLRKAAAIAANKAVAIKAKTLAIAVHQGVDEKIGWEKIGQAMAEGAYFGGYRYDEYITEAENGRAETLAIEIIDSQAARLKKLSDGISIGSVIGKTQCFIRTIANRPGNVINPPSLAEAAKKMAAGTKGLSCTVFDEKKLKQLGMGGILAVGSGSKNPPRLIVLKYSPKGKTAGKKGAVALVGKAITFDSGGISIKPSANMEQMKFDKSGGLAVLGAVKAAAELKLPVSVYGIIPSAENLPSGSSYRPGDILTTYSGKTVEVDNTDAEGRLILCDAITYAVKQKCGVIIDIATLTGACVVALGQHMAGLMSNDDELIERLKNAASLSGERVWHLPSGDEYAEEMKSRIADLKNAGGRWGGACTAAAFLRQFVAQAKWAHIDMAGVDMFEKAADGITEGASGYGVRLLTQFLMEKARKRSI